MIDCENIVQTTMAWPQENQLPHTGPIKVHINPNFRGKPNLSGLLERPTGIHLNPHWKPKIEEWDSTKNFEAVNDRRETPSSYLASNPRRTIHINPKVIPNGVPSISTFLQQQLSSDTIPMPIPEMNAHWEQNPVVCHNLQKNAVASSSHQKNCEANFSTKVKRLINSPAQLSRLRRTSISSKSPAIRSAKVVCSKYRYLNSSSAPSLAPQPIYHTKTATCCNRFKFVKKSQDVAKPGSSPKNHVLSRYKLVKRVSSSSTTLTPRRVKAQRIVENVKSIPEHTMKSRYKLSKGIESMPKPIVALRNRSLTNSGKGKTSRYKFVRTGQVQRTPLKRKSPRVLKSRFKIIRGSGSEAMSNTSKFHLETPRYRPMVNQASSPLWRRNKWLSSGQDLQATKIVTSNRKLLRIGRRPENKRDKVKKARLLKIGGVFYRSTRTTLTRSSSIAAATSKGEKGPYPVKGQILSIRGSKFELDKTGKTLRRLTPNKRPISRIHIGGVTFVPSSENTLVRSRVHEARNLVSQAKQRSIAVLTSKLRKNNKPCLIYQRLGKCRLHDKGRCPNVHDPKKIAICNNFVNGKCPKSAAECRLSHDVGPEKMPTCHFFLQGCCVRDPCPYSHVKLNQKAAVCRDFLSGYCGAGEKCKKRHVFLCPEYEETKRCSKGKYCSYRHADEAGKVRARNRSAARESTAPEGPTTSLKEPPDSLTRYYLTNDGPPQTDEKDGGCHTVRKTQSVVLLPERSKLGDLPGFIPL